MAAPTGGDVAVFASQAKKSEIRLIVGLDYPTLTAEKTENFASGIPDEDFWSLVLAPTAMAYDANGVHFKSWSGPAFEIIKTREHWVPDDPAQPFKIVINFTFPLADPVYSPMIIFGGIENEFGELTDPITVMQHGSATTRTTSIGTATEGDTLVYADAVLTPVHTEAYDGLEHTISFEWDPALAVNTKKATVKFDGVNVSDWDTNAVRPMYVAMGWTWPALRDRSTDAEIVAPGTLTVPVTIMTIADITSSQLVTEGYESISYPTWTSANAGGTIDTAVVGERFTIDGVNVAKIDPARVSLSGERGRSILYDTLSVKLKAGLAVTADPVNLFLDQRFVNRELWLDTRHENITTGLFSAWRRQGMFRITDTEMEEHKDGITTSLSARADVMDKLDSFMDIGFLGDVADKDIDENMFPLNVTIDQLLFTMITVSDALSGSLRATDSTIRSIDVIPDVISSGGQSLLTVFSELADQTASEFWCSYTVSGTGRHGLVRVHAWTLGAQTADYTFAAANGLLPGVSIVESGIESPNHANYRSNLPDDEPLAVNTKKIPSVALFPTHPYPSRGRPLVDSLSFAYSLQATAILQLKDKDNVSINGGVATHRYRAENSLRRTIKFLVVGHDWIEPSDEIAVNRPGVAVVGDTWVIGTFSYEFGDDGVWQTQVEATTSDWVDAIRRTV